MNNETFYKLIKSKFSELEKSLNVTPKPKRHKINDDKSMIKICLQIKIDVWNDMKAYIKKHDMYTYTFIDKSLRQELKRLHYEDARKARKVKNNGK